MVDWFETLCAGSDLPADARYRQAAVECNS
jgi:hypothetical protein